MRTVNLETWPRRRHFELFQHVDYPHFNLCAPVDLTETRRWMKEKGGSINAAIVYVLARAANELPSFRLRIRGDGVVEHEVVRPSFTVLNEDNLFGYCTVDYDSRFPAFAQLVEAAVTTAVTSPILEDEPGKDDLLFMTGLPWVAFTSIVHPIHLHPVDSVPRIAWGKFASQGKRVTMPVSVQAHHGLMDGAHVGEYYQRIEALFAAPDTWYPY